MKSTFAVVDLDIVKELVAAIAVAFGKKHGVSYADIRVEGNEGVGAYSEDGLPRIASRDWGLSMGVRVITDGPFAASGFYGRQVGLMEYDSFETILLEALSIAQDRAVANTRYKEDFVKNAGIFGNAIRPLKLASVDIVNTTVEAEYSIDPREMSAEKLMKFTCEGAKVAKSLHRYIQKAEVAVNTGMTRQLFASSEGSLIDQWWCSTGATVFIVGVGDNGKPVDLYHHTGNQLGFEAILEGKNSHEKTLNEFATQITNEAILLCDAKPAPAINTPVTVVLDPDLVALFAHEIIGHPSELDRAMKMEAGYAGRSWFVKDLDDTMVGKQVGSKLLTAFSDPTLKGGYGHYLYDDEGTPAKRVYHIKDGIYTDFMNSRETAGLIDAKPNGHYKANDASVVPLIRMSNSAIAPGKDDPKKIIADVKEGYYAVGHRIPSISESRENFQIAPRLIYEIKNGEIGQVFRDGRITADSADFFMSIDALGTDFRIFPIPNCGKGQPMQAKQVGNGGPTARAQAKIAHG